VLHLLMTASIVSSPSPFENMDRTAAKAGSFEAL
jgi:hypothetical protein